MLEEATITLYEFTKRCTSEVLGGEGVDGEVVDPEAPAPAHDLAHLLSWLRVFHIELTA